MVYSTTWRWYSYTALTSNRYVVSYKKSSRRYLRSAPRYWGFACLTHSLAVRLLCLFSLFAIYRIHVSHYALTLGHVESNPGQPNDSDPEPEILCNEQVIYEHPCPARALAKRSLNWLQWVHSQRTFSDYESTQLVDRNLLLKFFNGNHVLQVREQADHLCN